MANWQGVLNGRLERRRWFDFRLTARDPQNAGPTRFDLCAALAPAPGWRSPGKFPLGARNPEPARALRFRGPGLADWRPGSLTLRLVSFSSTRGRSETCSRWTVFVAPPQPR